MKHKVLRVIAVAVLLLSMIPVISIGAQGPRASNFTWLVAKQFTLWYGGAEFNSELKMLGNEVYLDADSDTYLDTATDDTVNVYINGAEDFAFTANTFTANPGSTVALEGLSATDITAATGTFTSTLDVTGAATLASDLDVTGNTVMTGTLAVGGAAELNGDITLENDETITNSVDTIIGMGVPAAGYVEIIGGNLKVGNGTPSTALDGEDAYVEGNVELDGTLNVAGASTLVGAVGVTGATTLASDLTLTPDATGGNAGAKVEMIGLPRIKYVAFSTMTNGSTETTSYTDDSSTGEYAPIDGDVTEAEGSADGVYRVGASSYKAIFADTAAQGDGFKRTIASDDLEANESIGMWLYSSATIASGDLQVLLTDDGGARNFNIGAIPTANVWTWVEVDISGLAAGTGDAVTEFGVTLTAQGEAALGAFNLYMDGAWKWDADDEEALGSAILQDGVLSAMIIPTAAGSPAVIAENTDFFVHYEAGNDFIVTVTDQSANSGWALIAY